MQPFTQHTGIACPLPLSGIDTDQLIPARFMKRSRAEGYGDYLLHDLRFEAEGAPRKDFPLNRPERRGASILVTRRNFGGGSSREAAAYALIDFGIRCVVAPSFGDIFASNSVNNGLLPARVSEEDSERLLSVLTGGELSASVDLETRTISCGSLNVSFDIEPVWRTKLLNGWDDIDLTKSYTAAIEAFAASDKERRPWMKPSRA